MTGSILLVEDDPNDVFFMKRAMKEVGILNPMQVLTDGRLAIDYFKGAGQFSNRGNFPLPELVLLDLKLPYIMGLEVLNWIRLQRGHNPIVIILTASNDPEDIQTAYRLGANAYLVKPSEVSELVQLLTSIRDFWLVQNKVAFTPVAAAPPPRLAVLDMDRSQAENLATAQDVLEETTLAESRDYEPVALL